MKGDSRRSKRICAVAAAAALAVAFLVTFGQYERPHDFGSVRELNCADCRVGALAGYDSERVSRKAFPQARIVGFSEFDDAFAALASGRLEAFVYGEHVLHTALKTYPDRFRVLDEVLAATPGVVLVAPGRRDLVAPLNRFIDGYRRSGVYSEMFDRWCFADIRATMPPVPDVGTNGVLRIGVSGTEEPSSYFDDDGALVGFDVEFARRFASFMRLRPEIRCLPDETMTNALFAGEIDLAIDDFNLDEAPSGVWVSKPYFDADTRVLVRADANGGFRLGSRRIGFASRLVGDPRAALFLSGFGTTCALTALAALVGLLLARLVREIERISPRPLQYAIDYALDVVRTVPPPVLLLLFGCLAVVGTSAWPAAVLALACWFAAQLEAVSGAGFRAWLPVVESRLPALLQWSGIVGAVNVCDLTMAADLVCGRSALAVAPLLSVAAAYCLLSWSAVWFVRWLERKLV